MSQKLKKILASLLFFLQITVGIGLSVMNITITFAENPSVDVGSESDPNTATSDQGSPGDNSEVDVNSENDPNTPTDDQSSPAEDPAPVSDQSSEKTGSGPHTSDTFPLRYLKTTNQNSSYLDSNSPIASFMVIMINFLAKTIGSLAFVAVIIGGFVLLTSNGNETMLSKGKDILKYAIIGLVIALSAYFITAFVQSIFYELPKT